MKKHISELMLKKYFNSDYQPPEYNPSADFEWIQGQSTMPWLKLDIEVPHQMILDEIQQVESMLVAHREEYGEHLGWKSFCIHGKSFDATREPAHYNDDRPHVWTPEAVEYMPQTVNYFADQWPGGQYQRIRIMLLEPGGYVSIHSDYAQPQLRPINIAITQPNDCYFVMEKHGRVPFSPGSAFWLDVSNRHTVFNYSDQPRWHIIVHQSLDGIEFQNTVVNSYNMLYNKHNEVLHNTN